MKFSAIALLTSALASSATAAPAPSVKSMSTAETWTIVDMDRSCKNEDTVCYWSFGIKAGDSTTECAYPVRNTGVTPASRSPQYGVDCGIYTITSGWSGQFGEGKGFTTLSVVDNERKVIAWPAYTDVQIDAPGPVKPDQSYPVQALP